MSGAASSPPALTPGPGNNGVVVKKQEDNDGDGNPKEVCAYLLFAPFVDAHCLLGLPGEEACQNAQSSAP